MMADGRIRIGMVLVMAIAVAHIAAAVPPIQFGIASEAATLDGEPVGELTVGVNARVLSWLVLQLDGTAVHTLERS